MDNIYRSRPVKILDVIKHTPIESSFILDFKTKNEPGKFVMISLPGAGEVPITISGFEKDNIEITIRNAGKVTSQIFKAKRGDYLYIRGPYGNTFPVKTFFGKHIFVIAGGSGVAAVKPIVEYFYSLNSNRCSLRRLDILAGFRSPKNVLFKKKFKMWAKWSKRCNVILTVDTNEDEEEKWLGGIGFVVEFIKNVKGIGPDTRCIVIGPPKMMANTIKELLLHGSNPDNIWVSFERHMKCGVGKCGHCRIREKYVCTDGPVFSYKEALELVD